jgi:hypothetical protein
LNIPLVLDSTLSYELSRAFLWARTNEYDVEELSEYYQPENVASFMHPGVEDYLPL